MRNDCNTLHGNMLSFATLLLYRMKIQSELLNNTSMNYIHSCHAITK